MSKGPPCDQLTNHRNWHPENRRKWLPFRRRSHSSRLICLAVWERCEKASLLPEFSKKITMLVRSSCRRIGGLIWEKRGGSLLRTDTSYVYQLCKRPIPSDTLLRFPQGSAVSEIPIFGWIHRLLHCGNVVLLQDRIDWGDYFID